MSKILVSISPLIRSSTSQLLPIRRLTSPRISLLFPRKRVFNTTISQLKMSGDMKSISTKDACPRTFHLSPSFSARIQSTFFLNPRPPLFHLLSSPSQLIFIPSNPYLPQTLPHLSIHLLTQTQTHPQNSSRTLQPSHLRNPTNGQIWVAGQIPADTTGTLIEGSIADKTAQCCRNISAVLEAAGSGIGRVVRVGVSFDLTG